MEEHVADQATAAESPQTSEPRPKPKPKPKPRPKSASSSRPNPAKKPAPAPKSAAPRATVPDTVSTVTRREITILLAVMVLIAAGAACAALFG